MQATLGQFLFKVPAQLQERAVSSIKARVLTFGTGLHLMLLNAHLKNDDARQIFSYQVFWAHCAPCFHYSLFSFSGICAMFLAKDFLKFLLLNKYFFRINPSGSNLFLWAFLLSKMGQYFKTGYQCAIWHEPSQWLPY